MFNRIIGIGWDVGGWMGKKQGVAVAEWTLGGAEINWLGRPVATSIPNGLIFTPDYLLELICPSHSYKPLDNTRVIVAIDAPLGFSDAYRRLVKAEEQALGRTDREIDNTLAYRYTEQHVYNVCGKKPLSATFDKLGNNCTVAVYHMQRWLKDEGYAAYPFDDDKEDNKAIIEVYPALLKNQPGGIKDEIKACLPKDIQAGTDEYDACLCAFLAILYGAKGRLKGFAPLVEPPKEAKPCRNEGWIYYLPKDD